VDHEREPIKLKTRVAVAMGRWGRNVKPKRGSALLSHTANAHKNGVNLRFAGVKGWRKGL
jgi:hypothetical protein